MNFHDVAVFLFASPTDNCPQMNWTELSFSGHLEIHFRHNNLRRIKFNIYIPSAAFISTNKVVKRA